jgi:hypothetical protein
MASDKAIPLGPTPRQQRSVDPISRRGLIGGAAAAIAISPVGANWTVDAFGGGAGGPAPDAVDGDLSAVFWVNAGGFHASALTAQARFPRQAAHFLAIAIELSLKSYLLHRGFNDDWNRIHLGHDLTKTLRCARDAGFRGVPRDLPAIAALLGPCYLRHAYRELSPTALTMVCGAAGHDAVRALHDRVGRVIRQRTALEAR